MRKGTKPGPKSTKLSRIVSKRGTLGEDSQSNESSAEESSTDAEQSSSSLRTEPSDQTQSESNKIPDLPKGRRTRSSLQANNEKPSTSKHAAKLINMRDDTDFRSPETGDNLTDYGLEFTTSNIQNPSPQRCSTLRSNTSENAAGSKREAARPPLGLLQGWFFFF